MRKVSINNFYKVFELNVINSDISNITKIIDKNKENFFGINEVYSTTIKKNSIRAWKKHTKMISNIIVIKGSVKFVFKDDNFDKQNEIVINEKDKKIILIKPMIWFGFKGLEKINTLINFSNILHNENEVIKSNYNEKNHQF